MDEAYNELYQQFLCLRSVCLRQAALLRQLTTALQKQQGATVPNGLMDDMSSVPVQCTQEIPVYLHEGPGPLTATVCNLQAPAAQQGINRLSANKGTFSDLLTEDMSKLCVDGPHQAKEEGSLKQKVAPLISFDLTPWQGASSNVSNNPRPADRCCGDRTMHTVGMPTADSPYLGGDFLNQSGGMMMMSDVALQSHVCEFCQAVFPGDTSTRGEFLRHLYTHVT